jgi:hypothetical protein
MISILIYSYGCYSYNVEQKENLNIDLKIDSVVLLDGEIIEFNTQGARYDADNMKIVGLTKNDIFMKIPYN